MIDNGQEAPDVVVNFALIELAASVARAYCSSNRVTISETQLILTTTFAALRELSNGANGAAKPDRPKPAPAVAISKSVGDDFIICLEDGNKLRTLKRYLRSRFDLTPQEYRKRWDLPGDYPMVAPNYSKLRSRLAKQVGLGRHATGRPTKRKGRR